MNSLERTVAGSHYINGRYQQGKGEEFVTRNPATGDVIANLNCANNNDIDSAVAAAKHGQKIWSTMSGLERGRILRKASNIIRERNEELSHLETLDTGKPIQETLVADALSAADCLEYYANLCDDLRGDYIPIDGTNWAYTRREPLGIVLGIGAWNYPIQIAAWKAAPALACGNSVIFKPSEVTPLSALKLAEIFTEAGLPDGAYNVLQGTRDVGRKLVTHPDIAKVSLTGAAATGRKVMTDAGESLKHVTLELGGKSPIIIFDDADIDNAVSGVLLGNFYSSGQICSNGTRVFVAREILDVFIEKLVSRTKKLVIGDPFDPETHIGPLISKEQFEKVISYIEIGKQQSQWLMGGDTIEIDGFENGYFLSPSVFIGEDKDTIAREEVFGPLVTILPFDEEHEVIQRANDSEYGLAAGVFTRDLQRGHRVVAALQAGTCWINSYNLTPVSMPFGGVKASGLGRENSRAALDHYSQLKSVYVAMEDVDSPY